MQKSRHDNYMFTLKEKIVNTPDVMTLCFEPKHGKMFSFSAGQYITLYFLNDNFGWQGKCYSISSLPGKKTFRLSVKKMGEFSEALHNLQVGEDVKIVGPAGSFCVTPTMKDLVFLAAGIGIAPFMSILEDLEKKNELSKRKVTFFYSNKTFSDITFFDKLQTLSKKNPNIRVVYILTQDRNKKSDIQEYKRISVSMIKKYLSSLMKPHYFICGSISFVNDLWRGLEEAQVPEAQLLTEAFY